VRGGRRRSGGRVSAPAIVLGFAKQVVVMATSIPSVSKASIGWRTPAVIVLCGCLISMISFGPRATLGFFLTPMSQANGWGRDVFGLALAIQNILWGIGQPFAVALAHRS